MPKIIKSLSITPQDVIESKILLIRGKKVMLDRDLANLYGVTTGRLNEQVRRNIERFSDDFMFQLSKEEFDILISQIAILDDKNSKNSEDSHFLRSQNAILKSERGKHRKYLPYVFTEQGVAMLSSVLNSKKAIQVNVAIMRTFVNIRKFVSSYEGLAMKVAELEKKYDKKIYKIFKVLDYLMKGSEDEKKNKKEIGFKCS